VRPKFLFAICQPGSEGALKHEVARRHPALRFSFSRPGFVTFRLPDDAPDERELDFRCAFARTWGFSLGKAAGADARATARNVWMKLAPLGAPAAQHLHVWQRERPLPGDDELDPASASPERAAGELIVRHRPDSAALVPLALNEDAQAGDTVLDCVIVEPLEWWLGWHRAGSPETRWPGGVPRLQAPAGMISRAYLKLVEALLWTELPIRAGDRCVELGSAPGGSCLALLERGCVVLGVDPAEMDPAVLAHPRFTHVRARVKDVERGAFAGCRWLTADLNVAPNYTLDTVEAIVHEPQVRLEGLVLTLKLTDPNLAGELPLFNKRIRSWGYPRVRARQLAFNRQEVCVVATRS